MTDRAEPDAPSPHSRRESGEAVEIGLAPGRSLRVTGLGRQQAAVVRAAWSRFPALSAATDSAVLPWDGPADEIDSPRWAGFHEEIAQAAARHVIDHHRGAKLLLHAAAVADDGGRALALAAPSGMGKTTGSMALARRWGYLTDETAVIDPDSLRIEPFPKPLSVLGPSGQRPKTQHGPEELGLRTAPDSHLHALGVLQRHAPGTDDARLERLPLIEALRLLIPQTSSLSQLDRGLLRLLRIIEDLGGAWALHYADSAQLVEQAEQLLAQRGTELAERVHQMGSAEAAQQLPEPRRAAAPSAPLDWAPVPAHELRPLDDSRAPGLIRRAPVDDAVEVLADGAASLLLLRGESFRVLGGLGPEVWFAAGGWRRVEDLVAELVELPGAPADADRLIREAVTALLELGVLEQAD